MFFDSTRFREIPIKIAWKSTKSSKILTNLAKRISKNFAQVCAKFFVRSGLLAKLFKIYVVVAFSLIFSIYVVGSPLACPLGRLGPPTYPLVNHVSSNHATTCNNLEPWTLYRLLGTLSKSLASQEIRTKDIRLAVNSTKRKPGSVIISQVYSQACHTAVILDRARG